MVGSQYTIKGSKKTLRETVAAAWPDGLPASEEALWGAMDEDQRALAAARVELVTAKASGLEWHALLAPARLSRDGLYKMLGRWRTGHSLASLVPDVARPRQRTGARPVDADAARAADRLVRSHPEWSRARLVKEVMRSLPSSPSAAEVRRLVEAARTDAERERLGGDAGLGRRLVVGSTVLTFWRARRDEDDEALSAWGGFVVDAATGRVLGHAAAGHPVDARRTALRAAAERVASLAQGEAADGVTEFEVHLPEDPVDAMRFVTRAKDMPWTIDALPEEGRMTASRIVQLLGARLGLLEARPRMPLEDRTTVGAGPGGADPVSVVARLLDQEIGTREAELPLPPLAVPLEPLRDGLLALAA